MRLTDYSELESREAAGIAAGVRAAADRWNTSIVPVAISSHPAEDDIAAIAVALGEDPAPKPHGPVTPASAIAAIGSCRLVVTGSYHGAVFALAQGVPVVGVARSSYYVSKLLGLRDQFGDACRVVRLDADGALAAVADQLTELWEAAPTLRPGLLAAARRQIELSHDAYERATALVGGRAKRGEPAGRP
jgi:colanic acid/amylovoran biosynthesis protein